jgi:cytochrome c-type biogenesis protein CcmE
MTNATLAKLALTLGVAVAGGGFLIYSSVGHAQHYKMVQELVATKLDDWKDKELKVHGKVATDSITQAVIDQEMQRTFVLEMEGKKIRVFSKGPVPDTFKDQSEVVATGRLVPAATQQALADALCQKASRCPLHADAEQPYVVEATELMAKCPSRYKEDASTTKIDTSYR